MTTIRRKWLPPGHQAPPRASFREFRGMLPFLALLYLPGLIVLAVGWALLGGR